MAIALPNPLFDDVTDFLASAPTVEQLIDYKPPEALDRRLHDLLDKNEQGNLTAEERGELDEFLRVNHLLNMVVLKARLKLTEH
ncbi:MAG: hypothetical protein ACYDBJ_22320 [Aggregatilineales bacterium]